MKSCNKKKLHTDGQLQPKLSQIQKSPYFQPAKSSPFNHSNVKNKTESQNGKCGTFYRQKLPVATEGSQKTTKRRQRKSRQKLEPLPTYPKIQSVKKAAQDSKAQRLKHFLQHHDQIIRAWQKRALVQKVHFIETINSIRQRKGKSFSLKKKRNHSKSTQQLFLQKQPRSYRQENEIIKTLQNQVIQTKKLQKELKKLKTIQTQIYNQHLINLIEINDRNQRYKHRIIEHVKNAQADYIKSQKKKRVIIGQSFSDVLRQKTQSKYDMLNFYQNSEIDPQKSRKGKTNQQKLQKKINFIGTVSPVTLQQQNIQEKDIPDLQNNESKLIGKELKNLTKEEVTTRVQKSERNSLMNSKISKNLFKIEEKRHMSRLEHQKMVQTQPLLQSQIQIINHLAIYNYF